MSPAAAELQLQYGSEIVRPPLFDVKSAYLLHRSVTERGIRTTHAACRTWLGSHRQAWFSVLKIYPTNEFAPFICNVCDKGCIARSDLERHEMIHTGDKPFKCELCYKVYATSYRLKRHSATHTRTNL